MTSTDDMRRRPMNRRFRYSLLRLLAFVVAAGVLVPSRSMPQQTTAVLAASTDVGASVTLLPDGRLLVLGGDGPAGPQATGAVRDPVTGEETALVGALHVPRSWHSATVLANGNVLVLGGIGSDGQVVNVVEVFDPGMGTFRVVDARDLTARAFHTATLLTDGRVLVAGGIGAAGEALATLELFTSDTQVVEHPSMALSTPRYRHTARLLAGGQIYVEGGEGDSGPLAGGDLIDPLTLEVRAVDTAPSDDPGSPRVTASNPADGDTVVAANTTRLALRFSTPMRVETVSGEDVALVGPDGVVDSQVVPAEGGMLVFVTPQAPLRAGAAYTVVVDGAWSRDGGAMGRTEIRFTTRGMAAKKPPQAARRPTPLSGSGAQPHGNDGSDQSWTPTKDWKSGQATSPWQQLPPLQAPLGVTAIAGQVLRLDGEPLASVTLAMGSVSTQTDKTGRFLLQGVSAGLGQLLIDGRTANRRGRTYGVFEYGVTVQAGETNVLDFTSWMPALDTAHEVTVASPTTAEVVVTTPHIPGLELHIPPGSVIRDHDGNVVTHIGITPIPVDRPPFPLPEHVEVPIYFTVQPGGGYVETNSWTGAHLVYPNYTHQPPHAGFNFWHYDPDRPGWYVYGVGQATEDGRQVVPEPGTMFYEFTGAMIVSGDVPPPTAPPPGHCTSGGDPVDLSTGIYLLDQTDLVLPDVLPLELTRTYRQNDTYNRAFGIGTNHPYSIFLWSANQYQEADLVLPDGARVHYVRTSPGTGWGDAVFEHHGPTGSCPTCVGSPTRFYGSRIAWNGRGWDLRLKDGTVYVFGENSPLQAIRDRFGNAITLTRTNGQFGNITSISSPNGRWISFTYDAGNRITQATDSAGRTFTYTYDASGRLWEVTDPIGGVTEYTYDASHRLVTIKNPRGITALTNQYDANGRMSQQTHADGGVYQFAYTLDDTGNVTQTDLTDPMGTVRRTAFTSSGYCATEITALGVPEQETRSYTRPAGSNLLASVTDALNRRMDLGYDALGNVISITRLAGTPDAVTTSYTYEPIFNQLTSVTDPLGHTTTLSWANGALAGIRDPLGKTYTVSTNAAGQVTSITDPLGHTTQFGYTSGDLTTVTNPLNAATHRFVDAAGRVRSITDPLGHVTRYEHDALNRLTQVTDARGGTTALAYDPNGNLLSVTDALNHTTSYAYNDMDERVSRIDPLQRTEAFAYNLLGQRASSTDRKGQVTAYTYDRQGRPRLVEFNKTATTTESTLTATWDAGNRPTQVVDSTAGTVLRAFDGLDRLTSEITAQGTVGYAYDAAGRRQTMTVGGQPSATYTFDEADRLTQVSLGTANASLTYDAAGRRQTLTLPDGIVVTYGYDTASQITSITGTQGAATMLDLTYSYDAAGNRIGLDGASARTGIPQVVTGAAYDAANQLTQWAGTTNTYDLNGNLVSDGANAYTWNARNQLTGIAGPGLAASFGYDPLGRRTRRTVNGAATTFQYDGLNRAMATTGGTTSLMLTGLGLDEYFARLDGPAATSFLTDALGSTVALADDTGAMTAQYQYEPFGAATQISGTASTDLQFTGRENDSTSLFYNRARYYSPTWGRFTTEDPLLAAGHPVVPALALINPQALDGYVYGFDKPLNYTDPTGENPLQTAADFVREYQRMREANTIGADKYFHCLANCEGAREGFLSRSTAELIGEARELSDQYVKGDPRSACNEDRAANWQGLLGDRSSPCTTVCGSLRPSALSPAY
jgi:RHS repeat-associated protein